MNLHEFTGLNREDVESMMYQAIGGGAKDESWPWALSPTEGRKFDQDKLDWSLLPWDSVEQVVEVLMFGAKKYGEDNWRDVPNAQRRYWSAAQRHMVAHLKGEACDDESGLPHLAHAACCVLFLLAFESGNGEVE
jgi:hypothetical protein